MNKNVLIIGNAGYMLNHKLGKKIDNFNGDIARFNDYVIDGYEDYVGTKCQWWFTNNKYYILRRYKVKNVVFVGYRQPKQEILDGMKAKWIGKHIVNKTMEEMKIKNPGGGMLAIIFFLELGYNVFIHGYDFYENECVHYYDDKKTNAHYFKISNQHHNRKLEKEWVKSIVKQGRIKWFLKPVLA